MKKKNIWIVIVLVVNAILLPFTLGFPEEASARSSGHMYDCCKESSRGGEYCCAHCCWIPWGCGDRDTCGDN